MGMVPMGADNTFYSIAVLNGIMDNEIRRRYELTFDEFAEIVFRSRIIVEDKKDVNAIIPAEFKKATDIGVELTNYHHCVRRCADNLLFQTMIPADYDGGERIGDIVRKFKHYSYVGYTSHSHGKKGEDKFRLFFPLKDPMPNEEYTSRRHSIMEWLGNADKTTLSRSRAFYLPSSPRCYAKLAKDWINKGELLDWRQFSPMEPSNEVYQHYENNEEISEELKNKVFDKLMSCGIVDYHTWEQMGSAMYSSGYSEYQWAQVSDVCRAHKPDRNIKGQWRSSSRRRGSFGFLINVIRKNVDPYFLRKRDYE